ncbi:MAG: MBL fold metallo-hydrolase [Clostridia bacterium]|nr:MBL fold metallo-hydrolase [Clostridia bacterium]
MDTSKQKIRIRVLRCGKVGVDPSWVDRELSGNAYAYSGVLRSRKTRIWLPVRAFLIEHPKGKVLVNTGWNVSVRERPLMTLGPMLFSVKPYLPVGEAIGERLEMLGISPKDLKAVILTHMETDVAGGLAQVQQAQRILVNREMWLHANSIHPVFNTVSRDWRGIRVRNYRFPQENHPDAELCRDVFGDKSVEIVPLPGRVRGAVGVRISWNGKFVLLVGDAAYSSDSWNYLMLPGPLDNALDETITLDWIRKQAQKEDCVAVLATHDPAVQPDLIELGSRVNLYYFGNRTNAFKR